MAIAAPKWVMKMGNVYPTKQGWVLEKGVKRKIEVIKAMVISAEEIAEWYAEQNQPYQQTVIAPEPVVVDIPDAEPLVPSTVSTHQAETTEAFVKKENVMPPRGINPDFYKNPETGKWEKKPVTESKVQSLNEAPSAERELTQSEIDHHYNGEKIH